MSRYEELEEVFDLSSRINILNEFQTKPGKTLARLLTSHQSVENFREVRTEKWFELLMTASQHL